MRRPSRPPNCRKTTFGLRSWIALLRLCRRPVRPITDHATRKCRGAEYSARLGVSERFARLQSDWRGPRARNSGVLFATYHRASVIDFSLAVAWDDMPVI